MDAFKKTVKVETENKIFVNDFEKNKLIVYNKDGLVILMLPFNILQINPQTILVRQGLDIMLLPRGEHEDIIRVFEDYTAPATKKKTTTKKGGSKKKVK